VHARPVFTSAPRIHDTRHSHVGWLIDAGWDPYAIQLGEKVAATDPAAGVTTAQSVTALHVNLDRELTDVTVQPVNEGDGDRSTRGPTTLHTTQNHPFWDATTKACVDAKDLKVGESTLTGPDGRLLLISGIRNLTGAAPVRDLTVDTVHTYYVVAGDTPVLVHNNNCPRFVAGPDEITDLQGPTGVGLNRQSGNAFRDIVA
jgi:Pretoxin HINT domain